LQYRYYTRTQ